MALIPASGYGPQYANNMSNNWLQKPAWMGVPSWQNVQPTPAGQVLSLQDQKNGLIPASGFGSQYANDLTNQTNSPTGGAAPTGGGNPPSTENNTGEIPGYEDELTRYVNSLNHEFDAQMGGLQSQYAPQQDIINRSYDFGQQQLQNIQSQADQQLATSERKAQENQVKNLRDIATNMQNQYMAGNTYLGARGAGDSSAANQYSYALNKMGTQQRANVTGQTAQIMADIQDRAMQVKQTIAQEASRIAMEKQNALSNLASQFAAAQEQIRSAKGANIASLNQTLLQQAITRMQNVEAEFANRRANLEAWAMNNATTIQQLQAKTLEATGQQYQLPQAGQLGGATGSNPAGSVNLFGAGGTTDTQKNWWE